MVLSNITKGIFLQTKIAPAIRGPFLTNSMHELIYQIWQKFPTFSFHKILVLGISLLRIFR